MHYWGPIPKWCQYCCPSPSQPWGVRPHSCPWTMPCTIPLQIDVSRQEGKPKKASRKRMKKEPYTQFTVLELRSSILKDSKGLIIPDVTIVPCLRGKEIRPESNYEMEFGNYTPESHPSEETYEMSVPDLLSCESISLDE